MALLGHVVVRSQFDDEHDFVGGLAAVREEAKWGYVNEELGVAVIPHAFLRCWGFRLQTSRRGFAWEGSGDCRPSRHFKLSS